MDVLIDNNYRELQDYELDNIYGGGFDFGLGAIASVIWGFCDGYNGTDHNYKYRNRHHN